MNRRAEPSQKLERNLGLFPATALVVGSVIGSGIFVSSPSMARALGSAPLLMLTWALAGVLTLLGALTQCELAGQIPRTGGLYEFFREIFGEELGFFYGWANFTIAGSGAIAAIAFVFASYLSELLPLLRLDPTLEKWPLSIPLLGSIYPLADLGIKLVGSLLIAALTWLNIRGIRFGAGLQSASTSAKVLALLLLVGGTWIFGREAGHLSYLSGATDKSLGFNALNIVAAVGLALSGAFWAYDGWGGISYIAGEVRDPSRTIPRAIVIGTLLVVALYLVINASYLYILPIDAMGAVANDRVASAALMTIMGGGGASLIAGLILLSTFDTTNSSILLNGRVYFAMANDGLFWKPAGVAHRRYRTPHIALLLQGAWALVLLNTGSFDLIVSMYVFVNWIFYALMAVAVLVRRRTHPKSERPFQIPGYPFVPAAFLAAATAFIVLTLILDVQAFRAGEQPFLKSVGGLVLVGIGYPFYRFWRKPTSPVRVPRDTVTATTRR